ncbi:membrane or secreted protein [gut metagenome]|uniref:Membrane or secreted protein n=1 Tax=gut metagenome TaxID=749906 RepID=J9GV54_9ZZZZ
MMQSVTLGATTLSLLSSSSVKNLSATLMMLFVPILVLGILKPTVTEEVISSK